MENFYYVYILVSESNPEHHYTGITRNLEKRLKKHNSRSVPHSSKHKPWYIETTVAFRSKEKAYAFERYLKSHSGRAFASRHF